MGTLFERPPRAQKRSKFKNFCGHHQANDHQLCASVPSGRIFEGGYNCRDNKIVKKIMQFVKNSPNNSNNIKGFNNSSSNNSDYRSRLNKTVTIKILFFLSNSGLSVSLMFKNYP